MPGDYLFPERKFVKAEPVCAREINSVLQPPAERLNGHINQHNLRAPLADSIDFATGAFVKPHLVTLEVDPGLIVGASGMSDGPKKDVTDGFYLSRDTGWQVLTGSVDMSLEVISGRSSIAVTGCAWYAFQTDDKDWYGKHLTFSGKSFTPPTADVFYLPAQVQFAIRVDGAVVSETITGRLDDELRTFYPFEVLTPRALGSHASKPPNNATGPQAVLTPNRPDALNRPIFAVRIGTTLEIEPGTHTIDLVVRRVPCGPSRSFKFANTGVGGSVVKSAKNSAVTVYNRSLFVLETPIEPVSTSSFADVVTVEDFDEEDVLSEASLETSRNKVTRDAYNKVEPYQLARGAVNGDHLESYSTVLAAEQVTNSNVTLAAIDNVRSDLNKYVWPTTGDEAISGLPPVTGYQLWDFGVGTWKKIIESNTSSTDPVIVASVNNAKRCVIEVQANIQLAGPSVAKILAGTPTTQLQAALASFAICLQLEPSGAEPGGWLLYRPSIVMISGNSYAGFQETGAYPPIVNPVDTSIWGTDAAADRIDIPVTATFDFSDAKLYRQINKIGVYASATWGSLTSLLGIQMADSASSVLTASMNYMVYKA